MPKTRIISRSRYHLTRDRDRVGLFAGTLCAIGTTVTGVLQGNPLLLAAFRGTVTLLVVYIATFLFVSYLWRARNAAVSASIEAEAAQAKADGE